MVLKSGTILVLSLAALLGALSAGLHVLLHDGVEYTDLSIPTAQGHTISATLAEPAFSRNKTELNNIPKPGIVVFHGFIASKEWMIQLVSVLARLGYSVLSIDQPGHGANSAVSSSRRTSNIVDGLTALKYLREEVPGVNNSSVGLIGFSMGGSTTQGVARADGDVQSIVVLGNSIICPSNSTSSNIPPANVTFPQNILNVVGVVDELVSPNRAKTAMRCIIDSSELPDDAEVESGKLYGSLQDDSARKLLLTESDHIFGAIEPLAIDASARWFLETLPLPADIERVRAQELMESDSLIGGNALGVEFLSGLVGFLWLGFLSIYFGSTQTDIDYTLGISDMESVSDDELLLPEEASQKGRFWWVIHGLVIVLALGVAFLADGILFPVPMCLSFGGTFLLWLIILPLAFGLWLLKLQSGSYVFSTLRKAYKNLEPTWASASSFRFASFFVVWIFVVQLILYNTPYAFSFATPLLKSFKVVGEGIVTGRRILVFLVLWTFSTPTFVLEAELVRLRIDSQFSLKNVFNVVFARCWMLFLVMLVIIITNFGLQLRIFGSFSFLVLMIYPATGLFVISSVLTQFARSQGHNTMTVALLLSGMLSLLLSTVLPFEGC